MNNIFNSNQRQIRVIPFYRENDSNKKRVIPKNSFDRFGEDLSELIFSYLSFEEKFRFECVSKQWQYLIYNKVYKVIYDVCWYNCCLPYLFWRRGRVPLSVNLEKLRIILEKCQNIRCIKFKNTVTNVNQVFQLIIQKCHNLREIEINFNGLSEQLFFLFEEKYRIKLKKVYIFGQAKLDTKISLLEYLVAVNDYKSDDFQTLLSIITKDKMIFLNKFKEYHYLIDDRHMAEKVERYKLLVQTNKNNLETIHLTFKNANINANYLNVIYIETSKLTKLKRLKLSLDQYVKSIRLSKFILDLSKACLNIRFIEIYISKEFGLELNQFMKIFYSVNSFEGLKSLKISSLQLEIGYKTLKNNPLIGCKNLIKLVLNNLNLSEEFFASLVIHSPKLQSICCSNCDITENLINYLSKLSHLKVLSLRTLNSNDIKIHDLWSRNFIRKSRNIRLIKIIYPQKTYLINDRQIWNIKQNI